VTDVVEYLPGFLAAYAILFVAASSPGPAVAMLLVIGLFVLGAFAISFVCHGAWAVFLSSRPIRAAYSSARRRIDSALRVFFVFAAIKLASSRT